MLLLLHITIALTSIIQTSFLLFSPSKSGVCASYGLMALTLVSGTALVATTGTHILQACISGLAYSTFVAVGIAIASRRLAKNTD